MLNKKALWVWIMLGIVAGRAGMILNCWWLTTLGFAVASLFSFSFMALYIRGQTKTGTPSKKEAIDAFYIRNCLRCQFAVHEFKRENQRWCSLPGPMTQTNDGYCLSRKEA